MLTNEFDVILCIDGLSRYRANVNYYKRLVKFEKEDGGIIYFVGEGRKLSTKIILAMRVMKYFRKGCKFYLASMVDKGKEGVSLESVHMVNEFEDVFLEDLLSLPPEREIKFKIELLPGITPISQALYRMFRLN